MLSGLVPFSMMSLILGSILMLMMCSSRWERHHDASDFVGMMEMKKRRDNFELTRSTRRDQSRCRDEIFPVRPHCTPQYRTVVTIF